MKLRFETRDWRFVLNIGIQAKLRKGLRFESAIQKSLAIGDWRFCPSKLCFQQFPRVTSIGSIPPKNLGESRGPSERLRRTLGETVQSPLREPPQSPQRGKISSESLAEGCAPRMLTLRNFRFIFNVLVFLGVVLSVPPPFSYFLGL